MWRPIFLKEIVEVFGDSRTRMNVIFGPLFITPLLLAMIGTLVRSQAIEAQKREVTIGVVGAAGAPSIAGQLAGARQRGIKISELPDVEAAERQIRSRAIPAALVIADDAEGRMSRSEPAGLTVLSDPGNQSSAEAAERLKEYLRNRGTLVAKGRLAARGVPAEMLQPFAVHERELAGSSRTMLLLTLILPYMLSLSAIMGGLMAASNSVAGEKERGTLETLLVTPVSRRDIAVGKFLTVTATAVLSCTLSLVGMLWPFFIKLPMFAWMTSQGLVLKPLAVVALLIVQLPLAVFAAGVLLALSTYARNQKEMQGYSVPVMLFGTVGAMLSMLLTADSPLVWAVVPVTNAALVLKQALQGIINPPFIALACATSLLYAVAAVLLAAQLFRRESVLTRF